ncbi:hypothetical protein KKC94_03760 [Patescibacteria group bacterium]|nr:hypothetical protein [Patescibacteria group bacterium]
MCTIIEFNILEFSKDALVGLRISDGQVRVGFTDRLSVLPVRSLSGNCLLEWGNKMDSKLPRTGFCKKESILMGKWSWLCPEPVEIVANRGFSNGTWFQIREGIKGVKVVGRDGKEHVYLLTEPSTHYFKTMTGAVRMPVLIGQVI